MQLTNIARDVGEDARNSRLYLPAEWLREVRCLVRHHVRIRIKESFFSCVSMMQQFI
jgi:phytoene/squalene synthetase